MTSGFNRAFWDERVPIDTASDFYEVEGFKAGFVYRMPEGIPRLPLMYTLRARKPAP